MISSTLFVFVFVVEEKINELMLTTVPTGAFAEETGVVVPKFVFVVDFEPIDLIGTNQIDQRLTFRSRINQGDTTVGRDRPSD